MDYVSYGRQHIEDDDIAAVMSVLRSDWLTGGTAVSSFEAALGDLTTAPEVVACASGTAGLHLAMMALGVGPGDVVIVPGITFVATANCVRYVGGDVYFADVDPATGLMTPASLRSAIAGAKAVFPSQRLAAVIAVHLNGQTEDVEALSRLAEEAGAELVLDACHALGTTWGDEATPVGAATHAACEVFSFHPVKAIATGEGGAVTTRDAGLAESLRQLRGHGIARSAESFIDRRNGFSESGEAHSWYHEMQHLGFNYRLSDINSALGRAQLAKLPRFAAHRKDLVAAYRTALAPLGSSIAPVPDTGYCDPCWHLMSVLIDYQGLGTTRDAVMQALGARGLGTQVHYIPVFRQPYWRNYLESVDQPAEASSSGAIAYYGKQLSLPLHMRITIEHVQLAAQCLSDFAGDRKVGL